MERIPHDPRTHPRCGTLWVAQLIHPCAGLGQGVARQPSRCGTIPEREEHREAVDAASMERVECGSDIVLLRRAVGLGTRFGCQHRPRTVECGGLWWAVVRKCTAKGVMCVSPKEARREVRLVENLTMG